MKDGKLTCKICGERKGRTAFALVERGPHSRVCRLCLKRRRCQTCERWRKIGEEIRPEGRRCFECQRESRLAAERWRYATDPRHRQAKIEQAARWRQENPEGRAQIDQRYWAKLRADGERYDRHRQDKRIWEHDYSVRNGHAAIPVPAHTSYAGYVPPYNGAKNHPLVDAEPIATWLRYEFGSWPIETLASWLGEDSHLTKLISGQQRSISLHTADRIFVAADCPHLLALYYGDAA